MSTLEQLLSAAAALPLLLPSRAPLEDALAVARWEHASSGLAEETSSTLSSEFGRTRTHLLEQRRSRPARLWSHTGEGYGPHELLVSLPCQVYLSRTHVFDTCRQTASQTPPPLTVSRCMWSAPFHP